MDDPNNLPLGVQAVARNMKFILTRARTRDGINKRLAAAWVGMEMGTGNPVTGLYCFKYSGNGVLPDKQVPILFDSAANLKIEFPAGSGVMAPVANPTIALPVGSYLQAGQTQNRAYLAFTNIANPALQSSINAVYDLNTGILDPLGMRPVGQPWQPHTLYRVGELITGATGGNGLAVGHTLRCTTPGLSGAAEPVWQVADPPANVTNDGPVVWTENTLFCATTLPRVAGIVEAGAAGNVTSPGDIPASAFVLTCSINAGAGVFAAGRDIYILATLLNGNGETNGVISLAAVNTTLNDQLSVKVTHVIAAWMANLPVGARPTGWNLYVADVATGAAAPALAAFGQVAGGPFAIALNTIKTVNSSPAATPPVDNSVDPDPGAVDTGQFSTIGVGGVVTINGGKFVRTPTGFSPATSVNAPGSVPSGVPVNNAAFIISGLGNVDIGPRWAIVLFQNRNGYISGYSQPQAIFFNQSGNLQLFAENIPIGPPETAARIIAFTQVGASSAGPFAYIPENDTVNGINITSTVIADNVTTTAIFNFNDVYLQDQLATTANVQAFFDKIQLPACRAVIHSPTMDRMIYLTYDLPSGAYITPQRDPETIFASTGFVEVSETDGQNMMGWVHFQGIEYALKEESGHEVDPSADDPSNWQAVQRWTGRGPCGLRAYDVGAHFFVFVHKSGVFAHFGSQPEWISKELGSPDDNTLTTWKRINWNAAATIWVNIDDDTHEIRIGVPLDRAVVPSHVLKCNYAESVEIAPAIHSTIYSKGKFISSAAARKWSIDTIAANSLIRANRTVLNAPPAMDTNTKISQLLFASSFDSSVSAITPGIMTDNGNLIDSVLEGVAPAEALKDSRFGGLQAMIGGSGAINVEVLVNSAKATADGGVNVRSKELKLRDAYVKPGSFTSYTCQQDGRGERFRARFSTTGKAPGTWFEVAHYALYINPIFQVQASGGK